MSHRLFVGIRPPVAVREALTDTMEALEGARWQDDEQLHLTLRFVGEVERAAAEDLAATLAGIASPPFELAIEGVGQFERKGAPTAVWARVPPVAELTRLRSKIERACDLVGLGCETRRFTPHVTVARLSRQTGPIAGWLVRHTDLRATWRVDEFSLFEGHQLASGPRYEVAAHYPL